MSRPDFDELKHDLDRSVSSEMVSAVSGPPRPTGRKRSDREPIVRALYAHYHMEVADSIFDLHWMLVYIPAFRQACGFTGPVPSRSTFSRVFTAMAEYPDIVDRCAAEVVARMREIIPDLGEEIAADSTPVPSYSNSDRNPKTDPDATWGWHHKTGTKGGGEWVWGYKAHVLADANHDIPLVLISSTGKDNDTRYLIPLVNMSGEQHDLDTEVVIADRGYDSARSNEFLHRRGITPVIHIRRLPNNALFDGTYTVDGAPTCMGGKAMQYVRTDPKTGHHLYRCPPGGCDRKDRIKGYSTCDDSHWEDPEQNVRLFGSAKRRGSPEWRSKYRKRWSIERVFSRWKTHGHLRNHFFRDRAKIHLHTQLQMLAIQATILIKLMAKVSSIAA